MNNNQYKKRSGTAGIRGHLYETKLISLIYYRLIYDDNIEEFQLATNMDDIGAFDDICFKAKVKGFDKPLVVFIQAKHREGNNVLTLNSKQELAKYFVSYLKIKKAFKQKDNKGIFEEKTFDDNECLFVLYTTAKDDPNNSVKYQGSFAKPLHGIISTGDPGTQPSYKPEDVEFLCQMVLKEQISKLAVQLAKFLCDDADCEISMNNDLMQRFHVVLAQKVFDVPDIQPEGHRVATFRQEFFSNNEELLLVFKYTLWIEVRKIQEMDESEKITLKDLFCSDPTNITALSEIIAMIVTYNNEKFEYIDKIPEQMRKQLENVSQSFLNKAIDLSVIKTLQPRSFKVPSSFGNRDLTIRGTEKKVERRLNHLTSKITELINNSKPNHIIPIDDCLEDGLVQLSGGIASAVGNLLVSDDKMLKITDNYESLRVLAKKLYDKLQKEIHDIHVYRFEVKVNKFPQLSFQTSTQDEAAVREFLNRLLFYTNQANEQEVEEVLKTKIEGHQSNEIIRFRIKTDAMFLNFHNNIQKWWMTPSTGTYLIKQDDIYENSIKTIVNEPLLTVVNMIHVMTNKITDYTFNEDAVNSLNLQEQSSRYVIVTRSNVHTLIKVEQYLKGRKRDYVVLDLEYIINLPENDLMTLLEEIKNSSQEKTIIIECNNLRNPWNYKILETVSSTANGKNIIFIINTSCFEIMKHNFAQTDNIVNDEKINLIDMSKESKKTFINETMVTFQGEPISLASIVDNELMAFIKGDILNQIINGNRTIGKSVSNQNFEKIRHLYIEREIIPIEIKPMEKNDEMSIDDHLTCRREVERKKPKACRMLSQVQDDVVVLIADPGMGKSTFFTHLLLESKLMDSIQCIIRINLLEHARQFNKWQKNKTVIDTLESLCFLCRVAISEQRDKANDLSITLGESNGDVYLKDCSGDEWTTFEMKMFLYFYNRRKLIILLDGFDEICPHYAHEVLKLTETIKSYPRKHQMWITSRPYDKIMNYLETLFGSLYYELNHLTTFDQAEYLRKFWLSNIKQTRLSENQLGNIHDLILYLSIKYDIKSFEKKHGLTIELKRELPLILVYFTFVYHVCQTFLSRPHNAFDFKRLTQNVFMFLSKVIEVGKQQKIFNDKLLATPLNINLVANCFLNEILYGERDLQKWELHTNIFYIYERFMDAKLKRIRFQEKNQIDLCNPDNIKTFNKERAEFISTHKKMAAYTVFYDYKQKLFKENELNEYKLIIDVLKNAEEKTGLICDVVNDIPVFVHVSFAEYFAICHITDLVKSANGIEKQKEIWDFILNDMFYNCNLNVLSTLDNKVKLDVELNAVVEKNGNIVSALILGQNTQGKVKSSLCEAILNNLKNLAYLFLSCLANSLVKDNLMEFVNIVKNTEVLSKMVKDIEFEELLVTLLNIVRKVDESKLPMLFENIEGLELENVEIVDTDVLVDKLRTCWRIRNILLVKEYLKDLRSRGKGGEFLSKFRSYVESRRK